MLRQLVDWRHELQVLTSYPHRDAWRALLACLENSLTPSVLSDVGLEPEAGEPRAVPSSRQRGSILKIESSVTAAQTVLEEAVKQVSIFIQLNAVSVP